MWIPAWMRDDVGTSKKFKKNQPNQMNMLKMLNIWNRILAIHLGVFLTLKVS